MTTKLRLFFASPLFLVLALGCQTGNSGTAAKVSGKITYKGNPVTAGTVTFQPKEDGPPFPCPIGPDGKYSATDLPTGDMVVTIETETANPNHPVGQYGKPGSKDPMADKGGVSSPPPPGASGTAPSGAYVKIPDKYGDKTKSGMTATLNAGWNTKDFDLKD